MSISVHRREKQSLHSKKFQSSVVKRVNYAKQNNLIRPWKVGFLRGNFKTVVILKL